VDEGIRFRRTDLDGAPEVQATVANVASTDRGTNLAAGEARVHTVEHVLAAVVGAGIDNLVIELDAAEPPAADGSARSFYELLRVRGRGAGCADPADRGSRELLRRGRRVALRGHAGPGVHRLHRAGVRAPADRPAVHLLRGDAGVFDREIAAARTYGFTHEVEALRSAGSRSAARPRTRSSSPTTA
jgi:UDP-3-O-acyl-N-acetylglucosamine deacetylase